LHDYQPPFRVEHEITVDGSVAAFRYLRRGYIRMGYVLSAVLIGTAIFSVLVLDDLIFALFQAIVGLLTLWEVTTSTIDGWMIKRQLRGVLGGRDTSTIGEQGIDFENPAVSGTIKWNSLTDIVLTGKIVLLLRSGTGVMWLPLSAFGPPERQQAIVSFMRSQIAKSRGSPST
jgi:hypothetical protein